MLILTMSFYVKINISLVNGVGGVFLSLLAFLTSTHTALHTRYFF